MLPLGAFYATVCGVAGAPVSFLWRGHISQVNCMSEESVSNVSGVSNPAEVFFFFFFCSPFFVGVFSFFCFGCLGPSGGAP